MSAQHFKEMLHKVREKASFFPASLPSFHHTFLRKTVFFFHNTSVSLALISHIQTCVFLYPFFSISVLSSVCSSVISSKGLGVGYTVVRCVMVCDLSFLHSYLSTLLPALCWVSNACVYVCPSVCVFLHPQSLHCVTSSHLSGCRCLVTRQPRRRTFVSWTSSLTLSQRSTTKNQRCVRKNYKQNKDKKWNNSMKRHLNNFYYFMKTTLAFTSLIFTTQSFFVFLCFIHTVKVKMQHVVL